MKRDKFARQFVGTDEDHRKITPRKKAPPDPWTESPSADMQKIGGYIISGFKSASQSSDLMQWQDSSGKVLYRIPAGQVVENENWGATGGGLFTRIWHIGPDNYQETRPTFTQDNLNVTEHFPREPKPDQIVVYDLPPLEELGYCPFDEEQWDRVMLGAAKEQAEKERAQWNRSYIPNRPASTVIQVSGAQLSGSSAIGAIAHIGNTPIGQVVSRSSDGSLISIRTH
jgi:hypothetical protein